MQVEVRVIAGASTWMEGEAIRQLQLAATLPGMRRAIGLPDLHPGKGHPIGAAFLTEGHLYPHLVGGDIGCGMALWVTDTAPKKLKIDRLSEKLQRWGGAEALDIDAALAREGAARSGPEGEGHEASLGTVGGGNHFLELQRIESLTPEAEALGLSAERVVLTVHSGSRGYGEQILREHVATYGARGVEAGSDEARRYLGLHDAAVAWARANRRVLADGILERVGLGGERVLDVTHNAVVPQQGGWLHRKGAAPADRGPVVIPGSRGDFSYLVLPAADTSASAWSLAHGAGRRWGRADARGRLEGRFRPEDLLKTELGSRVVCTDKDLLYEEAPAAYKRADQVVQDLVDAGLCTVIAVLRPMLTYKRGGRE